MVEARGAISAADYRKECPRTFKKLNAKFNSAIYQVRYASVVLTFLGLNAACGQLGGLWVGYQTDRSITIDTKTGKFMELADFTSNTDGKVSAAVNDWYGTVSHENFKQSPTVAKTMKICDRPGNVITAASGQKPSVEPQAQVSFLDLGLYLIPCHLTQKHLDATAVAGLVWNDVADRRRGH